MHRAAPDGDGLDPSGRGELEQEQADPAAGAQNQQPAARAERQPGQDRKGGTASQQRGGGINKRGADADRRDLIGPDDGQLRIAPGLTPAA